MRGKCLQRFLKSGGGDLGFALPSVLMLVTLLTLVALSVLLLQHIRYLQAVTEVARVKADFAAQSGVARAAAEQSFREQGNLLRFADSSSAFVRTLPWGLMKLAVVQGASGRIKSARMALLGAAPPPEYKSAICFGGASRQLIMTGSTQIVGDISVGPMGTTVGTLPGEKQPPHLPVKGTVLRKTGTVLPSVDRQMVETSFAPFVSFLRGVFPSSPITIHPRSSGEGSQSTSGSIPDSAETIFLRGDVPFDLKLSRRERPLAVYVQGGLSISRTAVVEGAVAFYVSGAVRIESGARIDNAVVMSGDSIIVESGLTIRGQLIAPRITVGANCTFTYPSILCSYPLAASKSQKIDLAAGDRCEGMVILFRGTKGGQSSLHDVQDLVVLHHDATVVGAIYAEVSATLDGTVIGSVILEDLYFYQAPTSYFGWLRSARIDRQKLPEGFVVPQALGTGKGEVVVWL